jgi:hypothetical protein
MYLDFNLKEKDKFTLMDHLIHAADISNPLKPIAVYSKWTERVLEEFWKQVKKHLFFILLENFTKLN